LKFSPDGWSRIRARGFLRFVFVWGVLGFGLTAAAVLTGSNYLMLRRLVSAGVFSEGDMPGLLQNAVTLNAAFSLGAGLVLAVILWFAFERRYLRNAAAEHPVPRGLSPPPNRLLLGGLIAGALTLISVLLPWIEKGRDAAVSRLAKRAVAPAERFYDLTTSFAVQLGRKT
jgi:hypothetical protein